MPYKMRACERCETSFEPAAPNQRFCSEDCKKGVPMKEIVSDVVAGSVEIDEAVSIEEALVADAYRLAKAMKEMSIKELSVTVDEITVSIHKCAKL